MQQGEKSKFEKELERCLKPLKRFKNYETWLSWFKNAEKRAETYIAKISFFLRNTSRLRVLDVGCGVGGACLALAKRNNYVVGIDLNPLVLPLAKLNVKDSNVQDGTIDFILANGLNLPFREGSFNLVICNDVLEHVDEKDKLLKELNFVLDNNGHIFLTTPNRLYPIEPHTGIIGVNLLPKKIANKIASLRFNMNAELPSLVTYKQLVKLFESFNFKYVVNHPNWLIYDNPYLKRLKRLAKLKVVLWLMTLFSPLFTALCKKNKRDIKSNISHKSRRTDKINYRYKR